jgi:hypothetical protein
MAYTYHVDFSLKHITGVRNMTLKINARAKKNEEATKKCYEFSAPNVDNDYDSPEIVPVGPVKARSAPWLYGPACSLATRGVIYPCSRYRCCIPCPCRFCKKSPRTCQARDSCNCEECLSKFSDHKNFHQAFHQLCEFCCQVVQCFPAFNFFYLGAMNVEDSDAFTTPAVEDAQVERNYKLTELPGVKLTLEELGDWYNIFENRRRGLADKPWKCRFCVAVFKSHDQQEQLRNHIIAKHSGPQLMNHKFLVNYTKDASPAHLTCELCCKKFSRRHDLERHIGALHYEETFSCVKCAKVFNRKDNYRNHVKTHYDAENTCLTCGKNFRIARALAKHLEKGACGLQCERCAKTFTRRSTMLNHLKKCQVKEDPPSKWFCVLCGTKFETKVLLERHRKESSYTDGSAKFSCRDCRKKFCSLDVSLAHNKECARKCEADEWLRRFREEKLFQCEKCGLISSSETDFKKHFWNHVDKKKEESECKLCGVKFQWSKALKRHTEERFDTEGNPKNVCDVCGIEFCTGKKKKAHHIATHRDFTCSVCDQVFSMKKSLKVHEKNQIKLSCKNCDKIFCSKWLLKMHLERVHKKFLEAISLYID